MSLAVMLVLLILLVLVGVPIGFSLGASGIVYLLLEQPTTLTAVAQRFWAGANSFIIIALPLFILAGELMNRGGLARRLIDFLLLLVRPIRGGLAEVNVLDSMVFGGISGSSVADTAALGSVMIPAMIRQGYPKAFSVGVTVATSTMGMIIPPSIPMLVYAMISGESVGRLFLAGLVPGVLIGVTQFILTYTLSARRGYHPKPKKLDARQVLETTKYGVVAVIMPVIIVGSITLGIATATESAAVAVFYACLIGFFVYRELKPGDILPALKKTAMISATCMAVAGFSMLYQWILAIEGVPVSFAAFITGLKVNRILILIILDLVLLFLGTFVDVIPTLLLLGPILIPAMKHFGVEPLQLGTILIVSCAIGLATPPVGMCLNAASKISGMTITGIFRGTLPWLVCNVIILVLVTFVPAVSTWLPSLIR